MAELPEGTVFAGHRIDGVAGRGGMGVVYRATHLALDHPVALKVIAPELADDPRFRDRFVRESRTAVSIRHPNVVQVRHAGEEDGVLFVTMDFIEGYDLRALISAERRVEPARAARIVAQVASALDAAHERGLVHRDVKPGNVLIEDRNGTEHVYLTDFGLTKRMTGATELTASGSFIGTVEYMAPEQIRGGELDARTDVYALGCVAFATLTGEPPFARVEGDVAKLYAQLNDPPPRASERAPGLPTTLDAVLAKAMAKAPDDRHSSAGEFAEAFASAVAAHAGLGAPTTEEAAAVTETTEATEAVPPPAPPRQGRRRAIGGLAGLAVVAAVAGVVVLAGGDDGGGDGGGGDDAPATPREVVEKQAGDFPVGATVDGDNLLVASRDDGRLFRFPITDEGNLGSPASGQVIDPGNTTGETDFLVAAFDALWTADGRDDLLVGLDPDTLRPTGTSFPTGDYPRDVIFAVNALWVANRYGNTLTRIVPDEEPPTQTIPTGGEFPRRLAFDGSRIWAAFKLSGEVQAFKGADGAPFDEPIELGGEPHGLLAAQETLWIANTADDSVQKLDLKELDAPPEVLPGVCNEPRDVELAFGSLWVSCGRGKAVVELDPETGENRATIDLGAQLETIASSEGPDRIWAAGGGSHKVFGIDPGE